MARSGPGGYGTLGRPRRSGSAAWQWVIIGMTLGLGCSAIFVLGLLTLGVLNIEGTATEVAVQSTLPPPPTADVDATVSAVLQATMAALPPTQDAVTQPEETGGQQEGVMVVPSATVPATETQEVQVEPSATVQINTTAGGEQPRVDTQNPGELLAPSSQTTNNAVSVSGVPLELQPLITNTVRIDSVSGYTIGTSVNEVAQAVDECLNRDGGNCLAEWAEDASPPHPVTLDTFLIEQTEVTNAQYVAFLNFLGPNSHATACGGVICIETTAENEFSKIVFDSQNYDVNGLFANQPVVGVTWFGAQAYCEAIGRRLPTEAEWEYAARGPNGFIYPWGNLYENTYARTSRNRLSESDLGVIEVRSIPENVSVWGVFDMAGNAEEWVFDFYSPTYYSQPAAQGPNPQGPPSGTDRVVRGGSWDTVPFFVRSVHRRHERPNFVSQALGFRCVEDFDPTANLQTVDPSSLVVPPAGDLLAPQPTQAPANAAPTLPPLDLPATATPDSVTGDSAGANATDIPAVPPGG